MAGEGFDSRMKRVWQEKGLTVEGEGFGRRRVGQQKGLRVEQTGKDYRRRVWQYGTGFDSGEERPVEDGESFS